MNADVLVRASQSIRRGQAIGHQSLIQPGSKVRTHHSAPVGSLHQRSCARKRPRLCLDMRIGETKKRAIACRLARAQRLMRGASADNPFTLHYAHPAIWGAFALIGDPGR